MKRLFAFALTAALLLSGCGRAVPDFPSSISQGTETSSTPGYMSLGRLAQAEAVYPEFPALPLYSEQEGYEAYFEAQERYHNSVNELRGEGISTTTASLLTNFAARSTPLVLAGQEGENAIYSPISLWSALALLAQSSAGDSREQVLSALGADNVEALQDQVSQVWRGLYTDNGSQSLLLGNSIWLNSAVDGSYIQDTLNILANHYYSSVYAVPMGTFTADSAVTDWICLQTNGLIGSGGAVVETQADTLALLVSSLYYRAGWRNEFSPSDTAPGIFTTSGGAEATVDFMHTTTQGSFFLQDGYQAASLYTDLGRMVFLLPDEGVTPETLLQDPQLFSGLTVSQTEGEYGEIHWSVPKFDLEGQLDLLPSLAQLGIKDLLEPEKADLSSLTTLSAYLGSAKQLSRVKVDEEGVEAASATILTVAPTSAPVEELPVCVMDLNRPFLFAIIVEELPLFIGVVNQISV